MGQRVVSWIEHHAARTPDRVALVDLHRGGELTYGELAGRVRVVAWSLARAPGVGAGDRVAVLSRNDTRVFEVAVRLRAARRDRRAAELAAHPAELTAVSRDAEPAVLIHESFADGGGGRGRRRSRDPGPAGWASEPGDDDGYEALATAAVPADWVPPEVDDEAVWTIIYTSGTTGLPKGVQATHRGWLASLLGILVAHRVERRRRAA